MFGVEVFPCCLPEKITLEGSERSNSRLRSAWHDSRFHSRRREQVLEDNRHAWNFS